MKNTLQLIEYQPEIWQVTKDDIYAAIEALDAGLEHARGALIEHDSKLGRSTRQNRVWAEQLESDIRDMSAAIENLRNARERAAPKQP